MAELSSTQPRGCLTSKYLAWDAKYDGTAIFPNTPGYLHLRLS